MPGRLTQLRVVDQVEFVDRAVVPKGAAPATTNTIARAVRDRADGLTADAAPKPAGVWRVTAWRYLERLADDGTVSRLTDDGKAGRLKTRYRWRRLSR